MYKAVGESSWRDGVFSHAAPAQAYQASLNQFADGSLGAYARKVAQSGATRDGSLGRTFLPSLRGAFRDGSLGTAFRDGSLGDVTMPTNFIDPNVAAQRLLPATQGDLADERAFQDGHYAANKQAIMVGGFALSALALAVAYLYFKK